MSEFRQFQDREPEFTQQFIDAVASVSRFNSRHTGLAGAMMGILSLLPIGEEDDPPRVSEHEEAAMAREVVTLLQTDELAEMGIKLFDADAPGVRAYDSAEAQNGIPVPSSLTMLIGDVDAFKETVQKLRPTEEQKMGADHGVGKILGTAAQLVYVAYSERFGDDEGKQRQARYIADDQLAMFAELSPVLASSGFSELYGYGCLSEYMARHQMGTLADYIGAEQKGLLNGSDQFGPSRWQTDSNAEQLISRWTKALDYLKSLRDRPDPSPFYSELLAKLRPEFDEARDWIAEQSKDSWFFWQQREAIEAVNARWEQDFPLENSFYLSERAAEGYTPAVFDPNAVAPEKPKPFNFDDDRWWEDPKAKP